MSGLGCEVVVQLVLTLELEDEAVGHAFAEGFPGAVLACTKSLLTPTA
jgi:hypothetical protein